MTALLSDLDLPAVISAGSRCRILRGFGATYAVETYDRDPSGYSTGREVWFGASEGRAMLIAQILETRGYRLENLWRLYHA